MCYIKNSISSHQLYIIYLFLPPAQLLFIATDRVRSMKIYTVDCLLFAFIVPCHNSIAEQERKRDRERDKDCVTDKDPGVAWRFYAIYICVCKDLSDDASNDILYYTRGSLYCAYRSRCADVAPILNALLNDEG